MTDWTGDGSLIRDVTPLVNRKIHAVAVARITPRHVTYATKAAQVTSVFEIGSISKGITGLLYQSALDRQVLTPTTTLGDVLPLSGTRVENVTLASLACHHSGLPRLPRSARETWKSLRSAVTGKNPYGETLDDLINQAKTLRVGAPRARYSNVGFELLGHAVAAAEGTPYRDLLTQHITAPLQLSSVHVAHHQHEVPDTALTPVDEEGGEVEPWVGEAFAPAGGIRSDITDMATFTQALLQGDVPGVRALAPTRQFGASEDQIGAGWFTTHLSAPHGTVAPPRVVTWHNGATGGFTSWLGIDHAAGTGIVVLAVTSKTVDVIGKKLLLKTPRT